MRDYKIKLMKAHWHRNGQEMDQGYEYGLSDLRLSTERDEPGEPLVIAGRKSALALAEILNNALSPRLPGSVVIEVVVEGA